MVTAVQPRNDTGPIAGDSASAVSAVLEPVHPHASNLPSALFQLAALSQRLFGPTVMIESMHDPDAPQEKWMVFHVTVSDDVNIRREQSSKWYDEAAKILPENTTDLRLSIMPWP
jgi:hypothetical protein